MIINLTKPMQEEVKAYYKTCIIYGFDGNPEVNIRPKYESRYALFSFQLLPKMVFSSPHRSGLKWMGAPRALEVIFFILERAVVGFEANTMANEDCKSLYASFGKNPQQQNESINEQFCLYVENTQKKMIHEPYWVSDTPDLPVGLSA